MKKLSRLIKVINAKSKIKISISFYAGLLLTALSRSASFIISAFNKNNSILIFLIIVVPDLLNICVYLLLIWYFYANFIFSHINLANDMNIFLTNEKDVPLIGKRTYRLLSILIPVMMIFFLVITILTYYNIITNMLMVFLSSGANIAIPVFFFAYFIFLLVKFSGRPFKSEKLEQQSRNILYIVIVWSCARLFVGIFMIIRGGFYLKQFIDLIDSNQNKDDEMIWPTIYIMIFYSLSEFLPYFFALDYSFMMSYLKNENNEILLRASSPEERLFKSINPIPNTENIKHDEKILNTEKPIIVDKRKNLNVNEFFIKSEDINILEKVYSRKNGFGAIYKANYKNCDVICRSIKFDRLSRYELEDFSTDFQEIIVLEHPYITPVLAACVESVPTIHILYPFYKRKSLYEFLHVEKANIDLKKRLDIAKKIALGMEYLHENKIFHSHLCSRNIMLTDDLTPKISDFGFRSLKENASIFLKYKNKNAYSSPELLKDKKMIGNSFSQLDFHTDVYSFGMLLWELYTTTIPFNVKMKTIYNTVAVENFRPEITKDFNSYFANIIRCCWDVEISKRPNFSKISELLINVKI